MRDKSGSQKFGNKPNKGSTKNQPCFLSLKTNSGRLFGPQSDVFLQPCAKSEGSKNHTCFFLSRTECKNKTFLMSRKTPLNKIVEYVLERP